MPKTMDSKKLWSQINLMDAFLYLLAGSAMLIISISFLLWLRFYLHYIFISNIKTRLIGRVFYFLPVGTGVLFFDLYDYLFRPGKLHGKKRNRKTHNQTHARSLCSLGPQRTYLSVFIYAMKM